MPQHGNARAALHFSLADVTGSAPWARAARGAGLLTDDEILARLFRLNQERAGK